MTLHSAWQFSFDILPSKPVLVEPSQEHFSSDGGLVVIREFDERIGMTEQFAAVLHDPRKQECVDHTFQEMVRMRVFGILAGYADQNDHDALRGDPVFKLIAGRSLEENDLASQPTLSRFENMIDVASLQRLEEMFLDQFVASFERSPHSLTLDIDVFDDPTHGDQQLTFWHGYYDQYQYLVRAITCAENDLAVMTCLLHGSAHAALSADDDLRRVVTRLRQTHPDVVIHVRADCGFGVPAMYEVCEELNLLYSFGIGMNSTLRSRSDALLAEAVEQFERTGQPQRLFCAFWYRAGSWTRQRWVVIKVEANAQGTNRRAIVTNRPGAQVLPEAAYDEYADRGESENRNKELKCGLEVDRLSDHRFLANLFRVHLHVAAYNLLTRLRREVADPPPVDVSSDPPDEAATGQAQRARHNRRRERDPLGEGHPATWRTRLIKVAVWVKESSRRVVLRLSGCWPYLHHYRHVSERVLAFAAPVAPEPG
jgi:hypothetical protein